MPGRPRKSLVEGQLDEVRNEAEIAHAMIAKALADRQTPTTKPAEAKVAGTGGS